MDIKAFVIAFCFELFFHTYLTTHARATKNVHALFQTVMLGPFREKIHLTGGQISLDISRSNRANGL